MLIYNNLYSTWRLYC